jgi:hypothetical protein
MVMLNLKGPIAEMLCLTWRIQSQTRPSILKKTNFNIANHHKTQIYHNGLKLDLDFSINLEQHWQKDFHQFLTNGNKK